MEFFGKDRQIQGGAVQEAGVQTRLSGSHEIGFAFIADVQGGLGGDACLRQSVGKKAGVWFGCADLAGEGDGLEVFGDAQSLKDRVEAEVEVRQDVQRGDVGKALERLWDVREKSPCGGLRKMVVQFREQWIQSGVFDGRAQGVLESALHNAAPPRAIIVEGGGLAGEESCEVLFPGLPKGSVQRGWIAAERVFSRDARIGGTDGLSQMKERSCDVQKQASERHGSVPGLGGHAAGAFTAFA